MSSRKSAFGIIPHETFIGFTTRMLIGIEYDPLVLEDNEIKKRKILLLLVFIIPISWPICLRNKK
jgi:hypothetical protein